jgi:hypothetical protein
MFYIEEYINQTLAKIKYDNNDSEINNELKEEDDKHKQIESSIHNIDESLTISQDKD